MLSIYKVHLQSFTFSFEDRRLFLKYSILKLLIITLYFGDMQIEEIERAKVRTETEIVQHAILGDNIYINIDSLKYLLLLL